MIISLNSGLENRINGRRDPLRWPRDILYPQKSLGIVRLRTKSHGVFISLNLWLPNSDQKKKSLSGTPWLLRD
jgi:hypothetical protein